MPKIEKVTETYNGVSIECAKITIDKAGQSYRFNNVFSTTSEYNMADDYAWQMVAKANANRSVTLTVGDKNTSFSLTTAFARYTNVFYGVSPSTYPYVELTFPTTGTYWFYHVQLEHGNAITDWHSEADDAVIIANENTAEVVKKWTTFYDTKFEKTDDAILLNARAITANENNIAEVRSDMESSLTVQADQIKSAVSDIEVLDNKVEQYNSTITQRADNIAASVIGMSNYLGENYYTKATVDIKADGITSEVSATYETKTDASSKLTDAKSYADSAVANSTPVKQWSTLTQTVDGINTEVGKKVGYSEIISSINQTAESVSINASKVNLSGYVTFSNLSGAQSSSNNTIIDGSHITTGSIKDANSNTVFNLSTGELTMKKGSVNLGNGVFQVTNAGKVTASDMTITGGSISIKNGSTTIFNVSNTGNLTVKNSDGTTVFSAGSTGASITGTVNITGGSINLNNGAFYVDKDGNAYMNSIHVRTSNSNATDTSKQILYIGATETGLPTGYDNKTLVSKTMISENMIAKNIMITGGSVMIDGGGDQSTSYNQYNYINLTYKWHKNSWIYNRTTSMTSSGITCKLYTTVGNEITETIDTTLYDHGFSAIYDYKNVLGTPAWRRRGVYADTYKMRLYLDDVDVFSVQISDDIAKSTNITIGCDATTTPKQSSGYYIDAHSDTLTTVHGNFLFTAISKIFIGNTSVKWTDWMFAQSHTFNATQTFSPSTADTWGISVTKGGLNVQNSNAAFGEQVQVKTPEKIYFTETQKTLQQLLDSSSGGGGDVTLSGNNAFTGSNTFSGNTTFNNSGTTARSTTFNTTAVFKGATYLTRDAVSLRVYNSDGSVASTTTLANYINTTSNSNSGLVRTSSTSSNSMTGTYTVTGTITIPTGTRVGTSSSYSTLPNYIKSTALGSTTTGTGDFYTAIKNAVTTSVISGTASYNRFTYQQYGNIVFLNILFYKTSTTTYATPSAGISVSIPQPDGQYNGSLCGQGNAGRFFIKADKTIHFRLPAASDYYAGCLVYNVGT